MTEKEKKLRGEELAAKIREEFSRIEEEADFEMPYNITVHKDETEFGLEDVPGVEIHNECEDPIFIPDSEGMTEEKATSLAESLAANFIGQRREETRYYVVVKGEEEEEFDYFSYAAWRAESLFREKLIDAIKHGVWTCELPKNEVGNWQYKAYLAVDDSIFEKGPIIEERRNVRWIGQE